MKRNRVYLPKEADLGFFPDDDSRLSRLLAILESSFDGIYVTDSGARTDRKSTRLNSSH